LRVENDQPTIYNLKNLKNVKKIYLPQNPDGSIKTGQVGSVHRDGMNTAKQNGSVDLTSIYNIDKLRQQLGLKLENKPNNFQNENKD
jgi:hypothetical protein